MFFLFRLETRMKKWQNCSSVSQIKCMQLMVDFTIKYVPQRYQMYKTTEYAFLGSCFYKPRCTLYIIETNLASIDKNMFHTLLNGNYSVLRPIQEIL